MTRLTAGPIVGLLLAALVTGCVTGGDEPAISRYAVAADEPQAALIGRQILAEGGNAADAAVAAALTMAVTLPSRAGLGGGGACLVHDPAMAPTGTAVRALDFLPRAAPDAGGGPGGPRAAVPGLLRGLAALHAEYGTLRWETLVAAAENAARFGHPVSRVLARDIAPAAGFLARDPQAVALLSREGNRAVGEGDTLTQVELAAVLGQIRAGGVGTFYGGALGRSYAEAATAAGYGLSIEALRGYRPVWRDTIMIEVGNDQLHFAPGAELAGPAQALTWHMLTTVRDYAAAPDDERLHLSVEAQRRSADAPAGTPLDAAGAAGLMAGYAPDRATAPPRPLSGATTFGATLSILSQDDLGVTCGLTVNGLFGTGRIAPGTGIFIAAPRSPGVAALGGLAMVANVPRARVVYAGAGADVMPALTIPMVELLRRGWPPDQAVAVPRAAPDFTSPAILLEEAAAPESAAALSARGHQTRPVPALGRSSLVWCAWDRETTGERRCFAATDPRGAGLATALDLGS